MKTLMPSYIYSGFGFDVVLHNVKIKSAHGESYPDINMNEVKLFTVRELLKNKKKLTGYKLKFLRTFLKLSYQKLSGIVDVPASTLRLWEDKGREFTGLSVPQERQFRMYIVDSVLNLEKQYLEKQIIMSDSFDSPEIDTPLDLANYKEYSFLNGL